MRRGEVPLQVVVEDGLDLQAMRLTLVNFDADLDVACLLQQCARHRSISAAADLPLPKMSELAAADTCCDVETLSLFLLWF